MTILTATIAFHYRSRVYLETQVDIIMKMNIRRKIWIEIEINTDNHEYFEWKRKIHNFRQKHGLNRDFLTFLAMISSFLLLISVSRLFDFFPYWLQFLEFTYKDHNSINRSYWFIVWKNKISIFLIFIIFKTWNHIHDYSYFYTTHQQLFNNILFHSYSFFSIRPIFSFHF